MKSPTLRMGYHCPLKNSDLKNTSEGKFCNQCNKHIPDLRKKSKNTILDQINQSEGDFCASFKSTDLENPFGDKRDKLVNWYQNLSIRRSKWNIVFLLALFLITITGCRTRTRGVVIRNYVNRNPTSVSTNQ